MTFNDVTICPGRGFNVVVGPNGVGKSSIVSALTLGLGGDVSTLKRQARLADFVNTAAAANDTAEIGITLKGKKGRKNIHVRSRLHRNDRQDFWLDGSKVSKGRVRDMAREMQIQTDNLCQFLPQDVVREFPQMSPHKIFHNTVRAVGDQQTLDLHQKLVNLREAGKNARLVLDQKENFKNRLQGEVDANKKKLDEIKKREMLEEVRKAVELRLRYIQVEEYFKDGDATKKRKTGLEKKIKDLEATIAKVEDSTKAFQEKKADLDRKCAKKKEDVERSTKQVNTNTVSDKDEEVQEIHCKLQSLETNAKVRRNKLKTQKQKLDLLVKKLHKMESEGLDLEKSRAVKQKEELEHRKMDVQGRIGHKNEDIGRLEQERRGKVEELNMLRSFDTRMLRLLEQRNRDAHAGVTFLRRSEQVRNSFAKTVHEPMMLTVELKDDSYGPYVENMIGRQDMETFVCEDAADASRLMNILRKEQRLQRINVIHSPPLEKQPETPRVPKELESCLVEFAVDMVNCPSAVKRYLCERKRMNRVPVFSEDARTERLIDLASKHFDRFYIADKVYITKRMRYGGGSFVKVDHLNESRSCFIESPDKHRVEQLEEELRQMNNESVALQRERKVLNDDLHEADGLLMQALVLIENLTSRLQTRVTLKREIGRLEQDVKNLSQEPVRNSGEKARLQKDLQFAVKKFAQAMPSLGIASKEGVDSTIELKKLQLALEALKVKMVFFTNSTL